MASQGITLSFGPRADGAVLSLNGGEGRADEAVELWLDRKAGLWRLPQPPPELPDGFHFLDAPPQPHHPDEACEIFVREKHGEAPIRLKWAGPTPYPWADGMRSTQDTGTTKAKPDEATFEKQTAGVVWLRYRAGRLPIGVFPRNLDGAGSAPEVRHAMNRVWNMVADLADESRTSELWTSSPDNARKENERTDVAAPGVGLGTGNGRRPMLYQELTRLERLLWGSGGVVAAWQALMADPVVRLQAEYPVREAHLARRPVFAGSRGPWTLPDGWSPYREDGRVRDRLVVRSGDTPPNRLAVGLAHRVLQTLARLKAARPLADWHGYRWLGERIREAAEEVLAAPAFADVRRDAPVPLDSPTLQLNTRCRPLLEAWTTLDRGLSNPRDLPMDDVMLQPLAKTELLYELWCFVCICAALRGEGWGAISKQPRGKNFIAAAFRSGAVTVTVYASSKHIKNDTDERAWEDFVRSWSPAKRPDGLLTIERPGEPTVVAWDAKYRPWPKPTYGDDPNYQAHAFRDALRVDVPEGSGNGLQPTWSIALYPGSEGEGGEGATPAFYLLDGDGSPAGPECATPGTEGVGRLPLSPSATRPEPRAAQAGSPAIHTALATFLRSYLDD